MVFSPSSYGYRPHKSAHQALEEVRENVRNYPWVIDMDIKSFFDEVDQELLLKAVEKHVPEKWVKLYIIRWLKAPVQTKAGLVLHCISEAQSQYILKAIKARLSDCKLRLSEEKTKIVYCEDYRRTKRKGYSKAFDFLGHSFKPMSKKPNRGGMFLGYDCEISMKAGNRVIVQWKAMDFKVHKS